MWIKSQDKKKLIKTSYIGISEECKREILIDDNGGLIMSAVYETDQRALEVIKSIQRAIKKGETTYSLPEK